MTTRRAGAALLVGGAALLVYAASAWASGALERDRARAAWDASLARRAVLAAHAAVAPGRASTAPGAPVARLVIPSISLDEVVVEGVGSRQLNAGPGHLPGSVLPGDRGNSIISAHRDRHFHRLDDVRVGDTVYTETLAGRDTWVVTSRRVLDREAPALFRTADATLTLTTCWPVRWLGPAPDRLLLTARRASSHPQPPVTAVSAGLGG